jgi:UDP-N-acetylglucosamine 4-epimerase
MLDCEIMNKYSQIEKELIESPKTWLITGVAGFIGSNLLESLLKLNQKIVGLDNFSTGHKRNLEMVNVAVGNSLWSNFLLIEGDIRDYEDCKKAITSGNTKHSVNYILHQAAIGSVPRSINDPIFTNANNVDGFLNILDCAKNFKVEGFVYASSSSVYGDSSRIPKIESEIGNSLSPYALTKLSNELYSDVFFRVYGFKSIGLRYFNVFGPRQDPKGEYAAVIPKWVDSVVKSEPVYVNGDGLTSRDFCYIKNVVQANLLSAVMNQHIQKNEVYNVGFGESTTLNELSQLIIDNIRSKYFCSIDIKRVYRDFQIGDVRYSQADITKISNELGYIPTHNLLMGIKETISYFINNRIC